MLYQFNDLRSVPIRSARMHARGGLSQDPRGERVRDGGHGAQRENGICHEIST
jgi:hypothetical protein